MNNTKLQGINFQTKQPVEVKIEHGRIMEVSPIEVNKSQSLPVLAQGLVDLQVNGFGNIDFNSTDLEAEDVKSLVHQIAHEGITSFLPTLITNSEESIQKLIKTIVQARKTFPEVASMINGIHLEGPFLSKEDGARGAHNLSYIQQPNWDLFQKLQETANGLIKIITLSPEWDSVTDFIKKSSESGVIVAIGHTAATPEQIADAVNAGAKLSTHLGNAAHLMLRRHPNYIWEQLAQDQLWASIIADGFHLPDSFLKVAFRMKPESSVLISDCTKFAGLEPGTYKTHIGGEVILNKHGRLCIANQPELLAGSAQSLLWCVGQVSKKQILSFEQAWEMASLKPLELLTNIPQKFLQPGNLANLVLLDLTSEQPKVLQTILEGKPLYINQ